MPESFERRSQNEDRTQIIDTLLEKNKNNLESFFAEDGSENFEKCSFGLPDEVFQSLIPRKVLEAANNPENVEFLPVAKDKGFLHAVLIERHYSAEPLSDHEVFEKFLEQEKNSQPGKKYQVPQQVNALQAFESSLIESGELSLYDKIYLSIELHSGKHEDVSYTDWVQSDESIRGTGITHDFYENLYNFLQQIGYRFSVGEHNEQTFAYFQKLGKKKIKELPPELQEYLWRGEPGEYDAVKELVDR